MSISKSLGLMLEAEASALGRNRPDNDRPISAKSGPSLWEMDEFFRLQDDIVNPLAEQPFEFTSIHCL